MTYNLSRVGPGLRVQTDTGLSYYFSQYAVVANPDGVYPLNGAALTIRSASQTLSIGLTDIGTVGGVAKAATIAGVLDQIAMLGVAVTPAIQSVTNAGSIAAGAIFCSVLNNGNADGILLGGPLPSGATVTFPATAGQVYGAISYDATGTTFIIQTNR